VSSRPYGSAARAYFAAGYRPLPLPPRKKASPPEGYTGRTGRKVTDDDLSRWLASHRSGNIGLRLPPGVAGIDVDAYKGAGHVAAWEELTARCGPLPDAPWCSSRDDGISGVRLFRVPEGWEASAKLPVGSNEVSPGEVIQPHHRYVVAPPSIHPDTGRAYRWRSGSITKVGDLPALPQPWLDALSGAAAPAGPAVAPRAADPAGGRPGDAFNERADWMADILAPHGWEFHHESGGTIYVTRPGKNPRQGHSATIGHSTDGAQRLYVFSADAAPFEPETPYTKFAAFSLLNFGGDYKAAARELGRAGYGRQKLAAAAAPPAPGGGMTAPPAPPADAAAMAPRRMPKAERLLALAREEYEPRRATRRPYLLRGGERFMFASPDRRRLLADLRAAWRERFPDEAAPGGRDLSAVADDLRRLAEQAEPDQSGPDQAGDEDLSAEAAAPGIGLAPRDRGLSLVTGRAECPLPDGYVIPEPYLVTADGIHLARDDGAGYARVAWAWLFPVGVYVDPDGSHLVELAWGDGPRWVTRLIRRAVTKSGRKLVAEAGDAGLPVIEAEARQAERWLASAEAANREVMPRHPVARQLGWQADGKTFVTGQEAPWRVEPRYADQAAALAAHRPSGTLAGWKDVIAAASSRLVVQAGACAGLASPLLHPLGLDSFTVDISGRSTRGKTITAMVALSCWADPSDRAEAMLTWQAASVIGIEKRLNLVSGLTVVIDETRLAKDPALVDAVVYMIPKNHGRPRGGGWPNMIPWRAVVVSTGEQPATSFTTHQGASPRVLSICSPPFGTDGSTSRAAAEAVRQGVEAHYGTAGPAFAARLQAQLTEDGGPAKLRARHGELTEMLRGGTDMTARRAPFAACLALAAELAAEWGIVPFQPPGIAAWSSIFTADPQRDNRPEMALDLVREYLAAHADKICGDDGSHPPASGWIGHEAREGPALLPEKLREELRRRGYELDAVIPGWLEMSALLTMASQQPAHSIPRRTGGRLARHLIFRREILDPADS